MKLIATDLLYRARMNELSSPKFQLSKMKKKWKAIDPVEEPVFAENLLVQNEFMGR